MASKEHKQIWEFRKPRGRPRKFQTPDSLWNAAVSYFEWCLANPHQEQVLVTNRGHYKRVDVPKMRAMTLKGMCLHIGISFHVYCEYRKRKGFGEVCESIDDVMYDQKFTGAAAGLLNPVIIARDLGLKDKSEFTGKDGGPIETIHLSKDEYREVRKQMLDADDC